MSGYGATSLRDTRVISTNSGLCLGGFFFVVSLFSCPSSSVPDFFAPFEFSSDIIVLVTIPYSCRDVL